MRHKIPPWKDVENLLLGTLAKCSFFQMNHLKPSPNDLKLDNSLSLGPSSKLEVEKIEEWRQKSDQYVRFAIVSLLMAAFLLAQISKFVALFILLKETNLSNDVVLGIVGGIGSLVSDGLFMLAFKWMMSYYFSR